MYTKKQKNKILPIKGMKVKIKHLSGDENSGQEGIITSTDKKLHVKFENSKNIHLYDVRDVIFL